MLNNNDIEEAKDAINNVVQTLRENAERATNEQLAKLSCIVDRRALPRELFYGDDFIMLHKQDQRDIEYYAGFEYVRHDCVTVLGDYVVYTHQCTRDDRVQRIVDFLNGRLDDHEDEGEE